MSLVVADGLQGQQAGFRHADALYYANMKSDPSTVDAATRFTSGSSLERMEIVQQISTLARLSEPDRFH